MKRIYITPDVEFLKAQTEAYCSGLIDLSSIIQEPSIDNDNGGRGDAYVNDDL